MSADPTLPSEPSGGARHPPERSPVPTVSLFGIPLAVTDYDGLVRLVSERLLHPDGRPLTADASNTMVLAESCRDPRLRRGLLAHDLILPDGMPLVWAMNLKGAGMRDRVYGAYVIERVLESLPRTTRVGLIGGIPETRTRLVEQSPHRYPLAEYVAMHDDPIGTVDDRYVEDSLRRMEDAGAELVFVCLGVPGQYYWIERARSRLGPRVCIGVGGAFDFVVGRRRYAPDWMQRAGLTWLYRVVQEPRRLLRRYVKYNSLFIWYLLTREVAAGRLPVRRRARR